MDADFPPRYSTLAGILPHSGALGDITTVINNSEPVHNTVSPLLSPPSYSSVFRNRSRRRVISRQGRNTASNPPGPQVHEYYVGNGSKSRTWATLRVFSNSSTGSSPSGTKVPCFTGSDLVHGSLELDIDTPQNVNSINLSLRGRIITSSYQDGSCTFLDQPVISWTRSNGDPRSASPNMEDNGFPSTSRMKKFDGKFSGRYSWPFSFPFPKDLPTLERVSKTPAPQSFFEREVQANIQYELILRMTHGILRSDSKLHVTVAYVPDITPGPFSLLRCRAYGENLPLPGPEIDPEGWYTLPTASLCGRIFSERMVELRSTLALANPQSFTRGTIIPCHLSVECADSQALDLLAHPKSLAIRLVRRVEYYDDGGKTPISSSRTIGNASVNKTSAYTTEVEKAVWLACPTTGSNVTVRHFNGEIHLNKELQPSCEFPLFRISYYVELLPFESPVFKPNLAGLDSTSLKEGAVYYALLSHPITIATLRAEGPKPVPFTRPKNHRERRTPSKDFSSSVVPVTLFQCM